MHLCGHCYHSALVFFLPSVGAGHYCRVSSSVACVVCVYPLAIRFVRMSSPRTLFSPPRAVFFLAAVLPDHAPSVWRGRGGSGDSRGEGCAEDRVDSGFVGFVHLLSGGGHEQ